MKNMFTEAKRNNMKEIHGFVCCGVPTFELNLFCLQQLVAFLTNIQPANNGKDFFLFSKTSNCFFFCALFVPFLRWRTSMKCMDHTQNLRNSVLFLFQSRSLSDFTNITSLISSQKNKLKPVFYTEHYVFK